MLPPEYPHPQFFQFLRAAAGRRLLPPENFPNPLLFQPAQALPESSDPRHIQRPRLSPVRSKFRHLLTFRFAACAAHEQRFQFPFA